MNAAVDLGNSRLKILRTDGHFSAWDVSALEWEQISAFLSPARRVVLSSVNPKVGGQLERFLRERWNVISAREYLENANLPITISAVGIGIDRVLGVLGGMRYRTPPFAVVDIGTALTVTLVDAHYDIRGGFIVPGPLMQLRALQRELTHVDVPSTLEISNLDIGQSTDSAIRAGLCLEIIAFIRSVAEFIDRSADTPPVMFLTGGFSNAMEHLLPRSGMSVHVVPTLVLEGALTLVEP
jgi:type III pantothenate kinase